MATSKRAARLRRFNEQCLRAGVVPDELDALADRLRQLYTQYRCNWAPGYRLPAQYDRLHWRKVALQCHVEKLDPMLLVGAAFDYYGARTKATQLLGARALDIYRQRNDDTALRKEYKRSLQVQLLYIRQEAERGRDIARLLEEDYRITPLTAWLVARRMNDTELARKWEAEARRALASPACRAVYEDMFPEVFANGTD